MEFPISSNQERYIFAEKATDDCYALPVSFRIKGILDKDRLNKAISSLLEKHEMLRCDIKSNRQSTYSNVIHPYIDTRLDWVKLKTLDNEIVRKKIEQYFFQKGTYTSHELVRFQLIELPQNEVVFTFSAHHTVADGVSIGIIIRDLSSFYNSNEILKDTELKLKSDISYKAYCASRDDRLGKHSEQSKQFWKSYLAGFPQNTRLLMHNNISGESRQSHESTEYIINKTLHDNVKKIAKSIDVSTFSFYISLFHIALSRMTDAQEVVSVFQSSGRQKYQSFNDVIGLFSNALILCTEINATVVFEDYCKNVYERISSLLDNQDYPYHYVTRDTGIHPSIGFNWYPISDSLILENCSIQQEEIVSWRSDLDINLHCVYQNEELSIRTHFNPKVYKPSTIELLIKHFLELIHSAIKNPHDAINRLNSISDSEKNVLPNVSRSIPQLPYARIEDAFLAIENSFPDNLAVVSEHGTLSYAQLLILAKEMQSIIESHTKRVPVIIGIVAGREAGLIVAVLGTLLAKCSFAILDAHYPERRLIESIDVLEPDLLMIIGNSSAPTMITKLWEKKSYVIANSFNMDLFVKDRTNDEGNDTLAYWLFTSGTTGTPKCISSDHAPLIHFLDWQRKEFSISENDKFSLLSGLSHDPVLRDIFAPLSVGACLCIPSDDIVFSVGGLNRWLREERVTVTHITPQMGAIISGVTTQIKKNDVRLCFTGGDRLRQKDIKLLRTVMPEAMIVNVYGTSETPQVMGYYVVPSTFEKTLAPIGKGIDDVDLFLQSEVGEKVGVGEYGQIIVCTQFLSNGYKNNPSSNKEHFSFDSQNGERTYSTGDYGFYDEDGNIVFVGRGDDQLKIRGYRIEPADIVAHVESIDNVERALVLPYGESEDGKKIVCYIQPTHNKKLSREDINLYLTNILPSYMIPSAYILLDQLPLYPNGKINRKALPVPTRDHIPQQTSYVAPSTKREKELVAMWEKALGTSPIGIHDSFYDVGGDSLAAIGMMIEMEYLGISDEDCRTLFQGGTIADIAQEGSADVSVEQSKKDLPIEFITNLLVNCLRGFLVLLVVAGHWMPGFLERLPENIQSIKPYVTPIFNLSTPGFAIVFGMALGYSLFNTYKKQKQRFYHQIKMGMSLLIIGLIVKGGLNLFIVYMEGTVTLTGTLIAGSFYNVLGFYLLAVASLPLWFRFIEYKNNIVPNVVILIVLFILFDFVVKSILLVQEQEGILQLLRLYLVAKFSYFNLAAGSLMGFLIGYRIRNTIHKEAYNFNLYIGTVLILVGILSGISLGELHQLTRPSESIDLWKWILYLGVINVIIFGVWSVLKNYNEISDSPRRLVNILSLFGVIALPMFVLHGVILAMKDTFDVLGLPDLIGLTIVLTLFFGLIFISIKRLYRMYF